MTLPGQNRKCDDCDPQGKDNYCPCLTGERAEQHRDNDLLKITLVITSGCRPARLILSL